MVKAGPSHERFDESNWETIRRALKQEWDLSNNRIASLTDASLISEVKTKSAPEIESGS